MGRTKGDVTPLPHTHTDTKPPKTNKKKINQRNNIKQNKTKTQPNHPYLI